MRRFSAAATLFFMGDVPPRRLVGALAVAIGVVFFLFIPALSLLSGDPHGHSYLTYPTPRMVGYRVALIATPFMISLLLRAASDLQTRSRLRAKGYEVGLIDAKALWRCALLAAARMGNRRARHELLRALPSRDELEVTPLCREGQLDASLSEAVRLLARVTQRYAIHQRGEARRARAAS